jgi:hypothetical protein
LWVIESFAGWLPIDPIVIKIREEGIKADKIHVDDTPVPPLPGDRPAKSRIPRARYRVSLAEPPLKS